MSTDKNNIDNIWLPDVFKEVERQAAITYRALAVSSSEEKLMDAIVPTEADYDILLRYALSGAARIVSEADMIQASSQTPMDAINYVEAADLDLDSDDAIGRDDFTQWDKMVQKGHPEITFSIDGLTDRDKVKYTVVQTYIKEALIAYILFEWYGAVGLDNQSAKAFSSYQEWTMKVKHNSVVNNKRLGRSPRLRPFMS